MSESEMEQWLADDASKVKNPMFEDLRKHLSRSNIIDIMQKLRRLTIIPESLMDAVAWIGKTAQEQAKIKVILSDNPNILKFEIIEIFIKQNDFVTKEEWTNQMKEELDYLKKEHIFPFSVMWEFERATREVDVDLTLGNIREIKKIISG
jgi:O-glycosyl hydrolase